MKLGIVLLAAAGLAAQPGPTHPRAADISAGVPAPAACSIMVFVPQRGYVPASIDPAIICDTTGPVVWIRLATAPPGTASGSKATEVLTATGTQAIVLAHNIILGSERVYKNGIRMTAGGDYAVVAFHSGSGVEFTAGQTINAGDIIVVEYRWHDPSAGT